MARLYTSLIYLSSKFSNPYTKILLMIYVFTDVTLRYSSAQMHVIAYYRFRNENEAKKTAPHTCEKLSPKHTHRVHICPLIGINNDNTHHIIE